MVNTIIKEDGKDDEIPDQSLSQSLLTQDPKPGQSSPPKDTEPGKTDNPTKEAPKTIPSKPSGSTQEERRKKYEHVCRFFKIGQCKFGRECNNEHPKICTIKSNLGRH